MRPWLGVTVVLGLLALVAFAVMRPDLVPGNFDLPRLIYLLMVLLLVSGAAFGFRRFRASGAGAFISLAVWAVLIGAIAFAYAWFR